MALKVKADPGGDDQEPSNCPLQSHSENISRMISIGAIMSQICSNIFMVVIYLRQQKIRTENKPDQKQNILVG